MKSRDEFDVPAAGTVSRREFFAGAGMTAGAFAALASVGGLARSGPAQAAATKDRRYYANFVSLELDGQYAGNLLSAEGGEPVIVPAGQPLGESKTAATATLRYEPLRLRLGDMSASVFQWVADATNGQIAGRQAAVVSYDQDGREVYRLAMLGVRPLAIVTDGLDAASREIMRFELTLAPAQSTHVLNGKSSNAVVKTGLAPKSLIRSNFRLYVQGYESTTLRVRTIDPVGLEARPDGLLVPMPLKFEMVFNDAGPMFSWMNDTLAGKSGPRQAELQLLTADLAKVSASIAFDQLSILRMSCPAQLNFGNNVPRVEVECMPGTLRFNLGDLLK